MSDQFEYRERLVNMCLKYRPEKLATIDKVLKMFQGREEELMNSLVKNYGPEPSLEEVQQLRANAPTLPRTAIDINTSNVSTTSSTSFLSRRKSNQQSSNESDSAIVGAPPASASPNGHDGVNEGDPSCKTSSPPYHDRLRNMYLFYNPNKSGSVSKLLTTCEGKEEELLSALVRKYGPEPTPEMMNALHEAQSLQQQQEEEDPRSRLTNIYMKYNRPKLSSVDQDLAAYHGREDQLFAMLQRLYGPEPTREEMLFIRRQHAQASNHADRLRILFLKYCPERLTEVSSLLKTYEGHEDALIRELVVRYGAEPDSEEANRLLQRLRTNAEATISSGRQWSSLDNHTKLMFFYMKYNPKLVPNVDSILSSCPGMEEQLFRDLIKKYGPIPSDEELIVIQNAIQEKERRAKKLLESMPIKERVLIFYLKHAPEKAIHVEGIVAQCGGNYEQLIEDLKSRYGAEPEEHEIPALRREAASLIRRNVCAQRTGEAQAGLSKPSTIVNKFFLSSDSCEAAQNGTKPDVKEDVRHEKIAVSNCAQYPVCYRERAQRFYQKYDPSKLESLDMIMKEYAGREDMLMMALLAHYGPEPQEECTPSASVAKPQVACEKIEPINTPKASGETTSTHDAIEETVQAIGPVSTCVVSSDNSLYRTRILRLYRMYDPEMVPEIDTVLANFVGKESELIARLCARYGPEPTEETDVAEIQAADATLALEQSTKVESVDFRSRLIYLFMFYDPEKLCCVDRYLIQYAGEESEMMKMFIQLYGNEPTPEEVALRVYNESVRAAHSSDAESDATVTFGSTLNAFSLRYDPELMSTLEIMFSKFAHQIEAKAEALRASGAEKSQQSVATSQTESMCVDAAVNTPDSDQVAQWSLSDRVQRFLFVYDFSKVGTESDLIASYGGDEKELIRALILQYGREPTNDDVLLAKQKRTQAYRWRVTKMVRYYDPENIADVDNLMKNFEDAGEELVRSLVLKYGPEPTDEHLKSLLEEKERTANYRERVRRFFEVYDPRRVGREQHLLDTYRGEEEDLIRTLVLQYGPEPSELEAGKCKLAAVMEQSQDTVSLRDRLRNFYTVYDSTLLTSIDVMVANYEHRAEELMGTLVKRYGPEPTQEQVDAVERVSTRVSSETPLQRIQVMLLKYAPDRMDSVESLLSSYQGKEMDLLIELVRKYGPEPDANETAQLLTMIPVNQPNVRFFAFRTRIVDFFCHYDPSQLNTVDEIVDLYSDAEDECMRELSARYGPEPTAEKFNPMIFETNFMV